LSADQAFNDLEGTGFVKDQHSLINIINALNAISPFLRNGSGGQCPTNKSLADLIIANAVAIAALTTALTFKPHAPATLSQANPVQGTYYTILDTTENVRLHGIAASVASTNETIAIKITVNGRVWAGNATATAGTMYYFYLGMDGYAWYSPSVIGAVLGGGTFESQGIKVEIAKTTNNGTGIITANVLYATR
jgi:hypothetical protein